MAGPYVMMSRGNGYRAHQLNKAGKPWSYCGRCGGFWEVAEKQCTCDADHEVNCGRTKLKESATGRRAETGPMCFGDDWRGVFIRGDNAWGYARTLKDILRVGEITENEERELWGLVALLTSSQVSSEHIVKTQVMNDYQKCHESNNTDFGHWEEIAESLIERGKI